MRRRAVQSHIGGTTTQVAQRKAIADVTTDAHSQLVYLANIRASHLFSGQRFRILL
jgi:hypothetical protein